MMQPERHRPAPLANHGERSGAVFAFTEVMVLVQLQEVWYGDEHLGIPLVPHMSGDDPWEM